MMNAAAVLDRIPKLVLFGVAALIQIALIAMMVIDRTNILRGGAEVMLATRVVDPRDLLRGDYVMLSYEISNLPAGALSGQPARDSTVYVKLVPNRDGLHQAVSVHAAPVAVAAPEVLISGRVSNGTRCGRQSHAFCDRLQIRYGLERYFVPQGQGRDLENALRQQKLTVVAAVTPAGRAAIKRLLIDGEPVYDEPWF